MRSQAGFTFTELLTVATVMAMLAAVAVPRHAMINSESRAAAVRALAANVRSSSQLANRIWEAAGKPPKLKLDGSDVEMRYGFPTAQSIEQIVVMDREFNAEGGYFKHAESADGQACAVFYIPPPNAETKASVLSYTDGC